MSGTLSYRGKTGYYSESKNVDSRQLYTLRYSSGVYNKSGYDPKNYGMTLRCVVR